MQESDSERKAYNVVFRNYKPHSKELQPLYDNSDIAEDLKSLNSGGLDAIKRELELLNDRDLTIIPRKPNHDLKNRVENKTKILKKRTQRVIVDLLRKKLEEEQ